MKVRTGFVSNSSTSSFVICVPQGSTEEQIHAMIKKHICPLDTCFLKNFADDIIDTILENKGERVEVKEKLEKEFLKQLGEKDKNTKWELNLQKQINFWQDIIDKNLDVYQGGFSDDEGIPIQDILCHLDFKIEEENFFMENNSGH